MRVYWPLKGSKVITFGKVGRQKGVINTQIIMKTVTVEIKNDIALTFLQNLESMRVLRIIENKAAKAKRKLSERFAGCLSKERSEELQKELTQMREEWVRDTY